MDEKLQKYYDYLKAQGAYVPDTYESFRRGLSTDEGAKKYHDYALQNGYYAPQNYDEFAKSLGVGSYSSSTYSPTTPVNKNMGALDNTRPQQVQQGIPNNEQPKYNLPSNEVFSKLNTIFAPDDNRYDDKVNRSRGRLDIPLTQEEIDTHRNSEGDKQAAISDLNNSGYDYKELQTNFGNLSPEVKAQLDVNKLMQMKETNPVQYKSAVAGVQVQDDFLKGLKEYQQSNPNENTQAVFQQVQQMMDKAPTSYAETLQNLNQLSAYANKYTNNGDEVAAKLGQYYTSGFDGLLPDTDAVIAADPRSKYFSRNQMLALQKMDYTNPGMAQAFKNLELNVDTKTLPADTQTGLQYRQRDLDYIGIQQRMDGISQQMNALSSNPAPTDEDKTKYQWLSEQYNAAKADAEGINKKYPLAALTDANGVAQELLGESHNGLARFMNTMGIDVANVAISIPELIMGGKSFFTGQGQNDYLLQLRALGMSKRNELETYTTIDKQMQQAFRVDVNPEFQKTVDGIKADESLTLDEKTKKLAQLIADNPDSAVKTAITPKLNLTAKSIWNGSTEFLAHFPAFASLGELGVAAGAGSKLSTFGTIMLTSMQQDVAARVEAGDPNPFGNAILSTAINAGAFAGVDKVGELRKLYSPTTAVGKVISQLDDATIKKFIDNPPTAMQNFWNGLGKSAKEGLTTSIKLSLAGTAGSVANKALSGQPITPEEVGKELALSTISQLIPNTFIGGMGQIRSGNISNLYQIAHNGDYYREQINKMVESGRLTPEAGDKHKAVLDNVREAYDNTPTKDNDEKQLSDRQLLAGFKANLEKNQLERDIESPLPTKLRHKKEAELKTLQKNEDLIYSTDDELISRGTEIKKQLQSKTDTAGGKATDTEKIDELNNELNSIKVELKARNLSEPTTTTETPAEVAPENNAEPKPQKTGGRFAALAKPKIESAVIEINGKQYEGKNHAEAILKAKADGQNISNVDRKAEGKFKLSDGTIIDRSEAEKQFGNSRAEVLIQQDEAAKQADKDYGTPKANEPKGTESLTNIDEQKQQPPIQEKQAETSPTESVQSAKVEGNGVGDINDKRDADLLKPSGLFSPQISDSKSWVEQAYLSSEEGKKELVSIVRGLYNGAKSKDIEAKYNLKRSEVSKIRDYLNIPPSGLQGVFGGFGDAKEEQQAAELFNRWKNYIDAIDKKAVEQLLPTQEVKDNTKPTISKEQQPIVDSNNAKIKGVEQVYKENEPISSIGTEEEYSQYLNSVFPDSKVKDILFHRSNEKFDEFDNSKLNKDTGGFFDFSKTSDKKQYGKNVYPVLLNIKKEGTGWVLKEGEDGTQATVMGGEKIYSVPDSKQIHILGSAKDIEGFKKWKENKDKVENKPTISKEQPKPNIKEEAPIVKDNSIVEDKNVEKANDNRTAFKNAHGVSIEEMDKAVEKARGNSNSNRNPIEQALVDLGVVKGDESAERSHAYSDYIKNKLEEPLPKKLPAKKDKISLDFVDNFSGNINVQPVEQKVKPVDKSEKGSISSLAKITSKDDLRPNMSGVYLDAENKAIVATDAHKLVWIDAPNIKKSKLINTKTGEEIDARFPDYKVVIPEDNPIKIKGLSANDLLNQTNGIERANKFIDGKEILAHIRVGDLDFGVDAKLLNEVLSVFAEHGAKSIDLEMSKPNRAIIISSKETPNVHGLVMPKLFNEEHLPYKTIYESDQKTNFQVKSESNNAELNTAKQIIKEMQDEAAAEDKHITLQDIQKEAERDGIDPDLIEKAYNEQGKETKIADTDNKGKAIPNELTTSFAKRVNNFVDKIFGKSKSGEGHIEMKELPKNVLGYVDTKTGKIILNKDSINPNTLVHEAGTIWSAWAKENAPELHKRGLELTDKSKYLRDVKANKFYVDEANKLPENQRENYYREEALATAIGDKGAQFVTEARRKAFADWAKDLWNNISKAVGFKNVSAKEIQDMTLDEFSKRAAADILKGEPQKITENNNAGSGKEPPVEKTNVKDEGDGSIGLNYKNADKIAKEFGLDERQETITKHDETTIKEADALIKNGWDVKETLKKMEDGTHIPSDAEYINITRYAAELSDRLRDMKDNPTSDEYTKTLAELNRVVNLSNEYHGKAAGRTLSIRGRFKTLADGSYGEYMIDEMAANNDVPLTDLQKKVASEQFTDFEKKMQQFDKDRQKFADEVAAFKAGKNIENARKSVPQKTRKTHEDFVKERQDIIAHAREQLKKARSEASVTIVPYAKELFAIAPDVAKIVKSLAGEGITKLQDVIDNIHDLFKDDIEGLTKKDIRDVIAGEYNTPKITKKEAATVVEDLRVQAQLLNKLDKLLKEGKPKVEKLERRRNAEIEDLRKQIADVTKALPPDESKLQGLINKNKKDTQAIKDKIAKGDFAPEEKRTPLMENTEMQKKFPEIFKQAQKSRDELIKAKQAIALRRAKQMYENKTASEKTVEIFSKSLNIPRTLMASMDVSAPLRQGVVATVAHPKIASEAMKFMFKAAANEKVYNRWLDDVHNSDMWAVATKAKLSITDPETLHVKEREEAFQGAPYVEKIPILGAGVAASERAYVGYLNKIRWDLFNMYAERFEAQGKTIDNNKKLYEGLASFINSSTGRGNMKGIESAAPILNWFLFASRLISSRLNMLGITDIPALAVKGANTAIRGATLGKINPKWELDYGFYSKLPKEIRLEAGKDMAKFIAMGISTLLITKAISALVGGDISVETDPRSTDFGKVRSGNTRWDIWGGFQPYARVLTQTLMAQQKSTNTGKIYDLNGKSMFGKDRLTPLTSFARGKLAPVPATAVDLISGRDIVGQKVNIGKEVGSDLMPLIISDVYSGVQDQGVKALFTVGIPSAFGVGVQAYNSKLNANAPKVPDELVNNPTWKYLTDKGIALPKAGGKTIEKPILNEDGNSIGKEKLNEQETKDYKDEWYKQYSEIFQRRIVDAPEDTWSGTTSDGVFFYGVKSKDLSKEQLKVISSKISGWATDATKNKILK